jgi:hypothetical protein
MKKRLGVALSIFISVPAAAGDIYKWTDEQGQLHFGDRPVGDVGAERVELQSATEAGPGGDSGLRAGERAWLREIEKAQRANEARKRQRDKRMAAEEKRSEVQARRCAGYRRKIRAYKGRLRAGCRVSTCNSYYEQIARYKSEAKLVCH